MFISGTTLDGKFALRGCVTELPVDYGGRPGLASIPSSSWASGSSGSRRDDGEEPDPLRLATAAVVLMAAVLLLANEIPPVPTWFYILAWYPTLVILDEAVCCSAASGYSPGPARWPVMLWWSAVIWLLFEAINFRLRDWYYVFFRQAGWSAARDHGIARNSRPAVLLPSACWTGWGCGAICGSARSPSSRGTWRSPVGRLGAARRRARFPRYLYPLTWGRSGSSRAAVVPARFPRARWFADIARGSWGRIARLMAAGCSRGAVGIVQCHGACRWIYHRTVPRAPEDL